MPVNEDEIARQARDHAWRWFALHAAQRMQTFGFFLVATAFLISAYASLLDKHRGAAIGVALIGAWIGFWFSRLDARTRQLINAGERALKVSQAYLADHANTQELNILNAVEQSEPGASSYRVVISWVQWTIVGVFVLAALYALLNG